MIINTDAIPNLDAADDITLGDFMGEVKQTKEHLQLLYNYAQAILAARQLRRRGEIEKALRFEHAAETQYRMLPDTLKW